MDIRMYVHGKSDELVPLVAGIPAVTVTRDGDCTVVTAPEDMAPEVARALRRLSEPLESAVTVMILCEQGGGWADTGDACVVCDPKGGKLRPKATGAAVNGDHAWFEATEAMYVYARQQRGTGSGVVYHVALDDEAPYRFGAVEVPLWKFSFCREQIQKVKAINATANDFPFPRDAVLAVVKKCQTYHCTSPVYADVDGPVWY